MNPRSLIRTVVLVTSLLFLSTPAHANMVIPLIAWSWIGMVYVLIPIMVVEAIVLWLRIDISALDAVGAATVANLVSTFAGIPICCWLLGTVRPKIASTSAFEKKPRWRKINQLLWYGLWDISETESPWQIDAKLRLSAETAAILMLLTLFFAGSWLSETVVVSDIWFEIPPDVWSWAMLQANTVSYSILAIYIGVKIYDSNAEDEKAKNQKQNPHRKERKASDSAVRNMDIKRPCTQPEWLHANEQAKKGMHKLKDVEARIARRDVDLFSWQSQIAKNNVDLCGAELVNEKAA